MLECRKRQVERKNGETTHRCINKKAEAYRQPVDNSICSQCPVRVIADKQKLKHAKKSTQSLPIVEDSGYPACEFRINTGELKCGVTGLPVNQEICNRCVKDTKDETPNLFQKAVNYSKAVRRWIAAGRPVRTQEEIDKIYDEHCSGCAMFIDGVCNSCGCPASRDQPPLRNKLKMATEACPLGRFPAKVTTDA